MPHKCDKPSRRPAGRQVTCHGCGEPGHIRPNCPIVMRIPGGGGDLVGKTVDALLGGRPVRALIDTGAGQTLVHRDFVPRACYTGRSIGLCDWQGRVSRHKTAEIVIQVGKVQRLVEVAVDDSLDYPAALGFDLGYEMIRMLARICFDRAKAARVVNVNEEVPMQVVNVNVEVPMHDEVDRVEPEVACDATVPLEDIFDFSDSYFEPEVACDATDVALEDIFDFSDSYFEPEVACDAPDVALEDIF